MADSQTGQTSPTVRVFTLPAIGWRYELTDERKYALRASLLVFVATFLVYWTLGPHKTAYDFQLSQANNMIHGHLDMTEEYTRNLRVLERVLYDPAVGFCLPVNDPRGPESYADIVNPVITANCKSYMQHSLGPAILLIPFAFVFGLDVNQTLISCLIGALTAVVAFAIIRHFVQNRRTQFALTVLAAFGTTYWYSAADGGVWHFAHTTAFFFVMLSIWATLVRRSAILAGAFVGAAFLCRPTTVFAGVFPLIYFANEWLNAAPGVPLLQRLNIRPLVKLALGVAPFILLGAALNYARFGSPFETGYTYSEQFHQIHLASSWPYGIASINYFHLHVQAFFEQMPIVADSPPYIHPSWWALATWVTTPAILLIPFIHLKRWRPIALVLGFALFASCSFLIFRALAQAFVDPTWGNELFDTGLHLLPFAVAVIAAVIAALLARDRLVLAAWAAILIIAISNATFAATGYAQFGYRYTLDYMPFMLLLIFVAVGKRVQWYEALLIGAGVLVNLWGVLWIFQFSTVPPNGLFGWTWISY